MSKTRAIPFTDTFIERGVTDDGIEWGLQPADVGNPDTTTIVDQPPYMGAVHIPDGHPFLGEEGRELMLSVFTEDDQVRLHRGKNEAVGWLGLNYAGVLDQYGDKPTEGGDSFLLMLAEMAGMKPTKWTRESVIEDTKRIAGIVAANK